MSARRYRGLALAIALLGVQLHTVAADITMFELARESGLTLQWDPFRRIGALQNGRDRLIFDLAAGDLVHNYARIVAENVVTYSEGVVFVSESGAAVVREFFESAGEQAGARVAAIVIDPGHGGRDPGASHSHLVDGEPVLLVEKDIVLRVSNDLLSLLSARYPDRQVVVTRDKDMFLQLEERVEIANAIEVDAATEIMVFVSVHANASLNPATYGYEVWYLPPEYGRTGLVSSDEVAEGSTSVVPLLNLMLDEEYTNESINLAESILGAFDLSVGEQSRNLGLKEEVWFVVRNAKMPSVLVELGFLTNQEEALLMDDPEYLRRLTLGLYSGVTSFIQDFEERYQNIE